MGIFYHITEIKALMAMRKKIIRHNKKPAEIYRLRLVCPLRDHMPNLHYNMAVIVNFLY